MKKSLFLLLPLLLAGCQSSSGYEQLPDGKIVLRYDNDTEYNAGTTTYTETIDSLDIEWIYGNIYFEAGDALAVRETSAQELTPELTLRSHVKRGELEIKYASSGTHDFKNTSKDLYITLPSTAVFKEIEVETIKSDEIVLGALKANEVSLEAVDASITGTLDTKEMSLDLVNGTAAIALTSLRAEVEVETVSANVDLTLPKDTGYRVEFETVSGEFQSTAEFSKRKDKYTFGTETFDIEAETVSGNLAVNLLA